MQQVKIFFRFFIFLLAVILLCISCRTTKKVTEAPLPVKLKGDNVIELFDSMMAHQFTYTWLSAKADVEYTDRNNETSSFDVNLRMKKDSAIWISITPLLGIEVARVLVTPDSMRILDRIGKTYLSDRKSTRLNSSHRT